MGGFGSGRPPTRTTCEAALKIDLAEPAVRRALNPGQCSGGVLSWTSHRQQVATIGYLWNSGEARLTLRYTCNGAPVVQHIMLSRSTPTFGGKRFWFTCPFSGARVRALYLPPGGKLWGSRQAYKLSYQSQRESGQGRALVRMLTRRGPWPGDPLLRAAVEDARDPFGFGEERSWERRCEARKRRNEIRRIARGQGRG